MIECLCMVSFKWICKEVAVVSEGTIPLLAWGDKEKNT
jgi:hypothetical protein